MINFFKPKPYNQGYLKEVDGHQIFYKEFGNKSGIPILITHGGPGGATRSSKVKLFNQKKYRIICFDQRGCGLSIAKDLYYKNTTQETINDVIRLLEHLNITQKVILHGSSWASTVWLLFAQAYPQKVEKLILNSIFLADKQSINWASHESKIFYPDCHQEVYSHASSEKEFYKMINSSDEEKQQKALKYYNGYERVLGALEPKFEEADLRYLNSAKIFIHYLINDCFIKEGQIIKNADKLKDIPTLLVHNRLDFVCPLIGAYELNQKLEKSKLVIVPDYGHGSDMMKKVLKKEIKEFL